MSLYSYFGEESNGYILLCDNDAGVEIVLFLDTCLKSFVMDVAVGRIKTLPLNWVG